MLNDDHSRLIAKVQHFHDTMLSRLQTHQDQNLASRDELIKTEALHRGTEVNILIGEYSKLFENFLYKDSLM